MSGPTRIVVAAVVAGAVVVAALVAANGPGETPSFTASAPGSTTSGLPSTSTTEVDGPDGEDGQAPVVLSDGSVSVEGRVVWVDGGGVSGAIVTLAPTGAPAALRTATDRAGFYDFRIPPGWPSGEAKVSAAAPAPSGAAEGPTTTRSLRLGSDDKVTPLVLWGGTFSITDGDAVWDPAPVAGVPTLTLALDGTEALTARGTPTGATFEPILLEDHTVAASASIRSGFETYTTSVVPITGPGEPISRRGACAFTSDNGVTRVEASLCSLTDGDFASSEEHGASARDVTIELGAREPITTIVVRGYAGQLRIEVSTDGGVWHPFATGAGSPSPAVLRPGQTVVARYVRIFGDRLTYSSTSEISVW